MKHLIVANWKANKNFKEAALWVRAIKTDLEEQPDIVVVICPSFINLPLVSGLIQGTCIQVGAQDVSEIEEGAYTGEVTASMLLSLASYALVGHSERRKYFGETDKLVAQKIAACFKYNITPIICVENLEQVKALGSRVKNQESRIVIAFEPSSAISTNNGGGPDTPQDAVQFSQEIKKMLGDNTRVLYGGSVNPQNVGSFLSQKELAGVLVGHASLDPQEFLELVQNASAV